MRFCHSIARVCTLWPLADATLMVSCSIAFRSKSSLQMVSCWILFVSFWCLILEKNERIKEREREIVIRTHTLPTDGDAPVVSGMKSRSNLFDLFSKTEALSRCNWHEHANGSSMMSSVDNDEMRSAPPFKQLDRLYQDSSPPRSLAHRC